MSKHELHEVVMPMDRWSARAVSPLDISGGVDEAIHGPAVIVHPGWGKAPEKHTELLFELAEDGFCPIGVDTRYAYADRGLEPTTAQYYPLTGTENAYFGDVGRNGNRWEYRRPTVTLEMCRRLGIGTRSYIGHSEGGRVVTQATLASPDQTRSLIIVNGAGTGDSSKGVSRLLRSNADRVKSFTDGENGLVKAVKSAVGSTTYAVTHPRRLLAEKRVIQSGDTWELVDELEETDVDVHVLHAIGDKMVSFGTSAERAKLRPWVNFLPHNGDHGSVYTALIRSVIRSLVESP